MSRFRPSSQIVVSHTARRKAVETRYGVNVELLRSLISTGPCNWLNWGDSISSPQAPNRLPAAMAMAFNPPNGWAGWFIGRQQAASSGLLSKWNIDIGGAGLSNFGEASSMPFVGISASAGTNCVLTSYTTSSTFKSVELVTGYVSPQPRFCYRYAFSGAPNYQSFQYVNMGPMGLCQFLGQCWASGDWLTNNDSIRLGMVHMAHANGITSANMKFQTREGLDNVSASPASNVNTSTLSPLTAPTVATTEVSWATVLQSSVSSPFGTSENEPGRTANPLHFQFFGVGTLAPGTKMEDGASAGTAGTYLAKAGNADWTGCFRITCTYDANTGDQSGKALFIYGTIIEDTGNTTGMYVDNISVSGDTIRTMVDGSTVAQMAAALNTNVDRPINVVYMHIGENHTTAEWNGGSISASTIRTDILDRIQRVRDGWDAAGLPRGLIVLSSPWETVGGTKSGSAWYTTVADIYRELARADSSIVFIDVRQWFDDHFTAEQMYHASRNQWMNILQDGVHPSWLGCLYWGQCLWSIIMGSIDE